MKLDLNATALAHILQAELSGALHLATINEVAYDTRKLIRTEGVVFFALKGAKQNGLAYIESAYDKGIRNFVVAEKPLLLQPEANYFLVNDVLLALQKLATFHRTRITYPIVAITGSIGKTTVKEWIAHLLGEQFKVHRSPKSYNSQLGVALSLLALPLEGDLALIEAAVTKPGEMERLQAMIAPEYCVITKKSSGFRNEFPNEQAYCAALELLAKNAAWLLDGELFDPSTIANFEELIGDIPFSDPVRVYNAKIALACALHFGVCTAQAVRSLPKLANRLETFEGIQGATLINDAYTLDLHAFEGSLAFLNASAKGKPKMVCCILAANQTHLKDDILSLLKAQQITHYYIWDKLPSVLPDITEHVVLIKGNQYELTEALLSKWKRKSHCTVVRYDLSALQHNLRLYQQTLASTTQILAMVKAQAYGAGLDQIAQQLVQSGINYFGVAYADEGALLRQAGIKLPILVMNAEPGSFEVCVAHQLEPAIYSLEHLDAFIRTLIAQQIQAYPIHLKIDTGMHRLGFLPEQIERLLQTINAQPEVIIKSVYSHMACADTPQHPMNLQQIELFKKICAQIQHSLPYTFIRHLLNSEGAAHFPNAQFDMVRLGIGLFGVNHDAAFAAKLKAVISWTSRISQIKQLQKGACVGYGCTDVIHADTQIAIIPVGYADGFKRNLSNGNGGVFIDGQFCPTVGKVCMDMIMVVAPNVHPDAEVEIIGYQQSLTDFASKAETIPYEILTSISPRVQRTYVND
jgi:alanine racemase